MAPAAGRPLVLAHRGARLEAPENTLPAFRRALELGADGAELDVQLTRDGAAIVLHDATLERTSDGQGPVARATLAELRRLDAGSWFGRAFAGTRLCTLAEALEVLAPAARVNVELKGPAGKGMLAARVLEAVRGAGLAERAILSSFSLAHLVRLRRLDGRAALAWLHGPGAAGRPAFWLARLLRLQGLHPLHRTVSERYVKRAHLQRLHVIPWTVNDQAEVRRMAGWGVDAIITDRPGEVRRWVEDTDD